ncbi:LysR family transcriptional regulator [Alcaligenaceae bacterium]|nr:LysR family transcriptional regulator [Alcaligenaceae bacterium]
MSTDRFRELTALVRVAESGGFASAARELDLTASAISKIVARLERRMGVRLLNRTSRSVALTVEGEAFVAGAKRVLEALEDMEDIVSAATQQPRGRLRVYCLPTFGYRLAPLLAEFMRLYPEVTLDIQLGTDRLDLIKYGFDIAIRVGQLEDSGAMYRRICETGWVVCAAPAYLEQYGRPERPGDLRQHNCLNFSVHTHQIPWQFAGNDDGQIPVLRGSLLSNQAELLRLMALQGVGIIRVSDHVVSEDLKAGRLVRVLESHLPIERDTVWAVFRGRGGQQSPRTRVFLDFLAERLADGR